ncbi:hypothetical protein [Streptomyces yaizuensis]|uniref:Uncharacterized protein n=1 Tax=Streptomyces yaizuensis TaxID=2989713 RepID=A0AA86IWV0_9ACTN|nr:hypothetical protein [Streptomyces sp. YSPA8]BDT39493.1 hypothetical protein SYYSPA8_36875 [Streptomyces sp. YSPA8]
MDHTQLEKTGITEEVMERAVSALFTDLTPQAEKAGLRPDQLLASWGTETESAYHFGYVMAARRGLEGVELSRAAAVGILYAFGQSSEPGVRGRGESIRRELSTIAYRQLDEAHRAAGQHPSFVPFRCCPAATYRDDVAPDLARDLPWSVEGARWRCETCGRPFDTDRVNLLPGESWAIRGNVLGRIDMGGER